MVGGIRPPINFSRRLTIPGIYIQRPSSAWSIVRAATKPTFLVVIFPIRPWASIPRMADSVVGRPAGQSVVTVPPICRNSSRKAREKSNKNRLAAAYVAFTVIRAYLFDPVIFHNYGQSFIKQFNIFLERLVERIKEENPSQKEREIRISLIQIISAILALGLPSKFFQGFSDIDLKDPETQMEYVNNILLHDFSWIDSTEITKQDEKVEQLFKRITNSQENI